MLKERETDTFGLPRHIGDHLTVRWATPDDVEELAEFNAIIHSDTEVRDMEVGNWTRELMKGPPHPTTSSADFTVVTDDSQGGKIVSSLNLISQTWAYDGIPFKVGRVEAVGTDPAYRRKKLVRTQMELVHAKSQARGEMVTAITGIPWYYRQFGYDMALNLVGGRRLYFTNVAAMPAGQEENYRMRPATIEDIPMLKHFYAIQCATGPISRLRDDGEWRYDIAGTQPISLYYVHFSIIEDKTGTPVAYFEGVPLAKRNLFTIHEMAAVPGKPLRPIAEFVCRAVKAEAERLNAESKDQIHGISFALGETHPLYTALDDRLEKLIPPYAWFMRVPDLHAFLRHIGPALENRLIGSVAEGYSGTLRLNFYTSHTALTFAEGKLIEVGSYTPKTMQDGDARFPDLTFLQLLFGYRSLAELEYARADCSTSGNEGPNVLLNALFPKRPSNVAALG